MSTETRFWPLADYAGDEHTRKRHHRKMDFGLGEILERFEKHFGVTATKILLGIISLAVVGVCLNAIWNNIVVPARFFFHWLFTGDHSHFFNRKAIIENLIAGFAGFIFYFLLVGATISYGRRWVKRLNKKTIEDANVGMQILDDADIAASETEKLVRRIDRQLRRAKEGERKLAKIRFRRFYSTPDDPPPS